MSEIQIMPDNPMSVLTLFDAEKKSLDAFIDYIANTIESGSDDPLKVQAISKKMEYVIEGVKSRIKEQVKTEAAKYGEHPFNYAGCEMHLTPTYTKYLYDKCNDPEWWKHQRAEMNAANERKERETFLRSLKGPLTVVDTESGEVVEIYPPVKTQSMGVKTTIK